MSERFARSCAGVTEDDLSESNEYVSVSRKALAALYEAVK